MSSLRHTAFKLVVAGGIAVASGLLALYKLSIEPVVLEDADDLGLVPGSSSMAGGSNTSSGSTTPDPSSLKRSPSPSPQVGMSRLGSFSTLATLAEEDEDDYEAYSPVKKYVASGTAAAFPDAANASADQEEPDWGDGPDSSPAPPSQHASSSGAEEHRVQLEIPSGNHPPPPLIHLPHILHLVRSHSEMIRSAFAAAGRRSDLRRSVRPL